MSQKFKLTDNAVKMVLGTLTLAALTVLLLFNALPPVAIGALAVIGTVALVSWILGLRQPTMDEIYELVGEAISAQFETYTEVVTIQDEEEDLAMFATSEIQNLFWSKTLWTPAGCLEWQGRVNEHGYGWFDYNRKPVKAHRFSAFCALGVSFPSDVYVLHTCDNPPCVNWEHFRLGDQKDNMEDCSRKGRVRNQNSGRTLCYRNHPLTEDNVYRSKGHVTCKTCHRDRQKGRR